MLAALLAQGDLSFRLQRTHCQYVPKPQPYIDRLPDIDMHSMSRILSHGLYLTDAWGWVQEVFERLGPEARAIVDPTPAAPEEEEEQTSAAKL